ncbi:MAG: hypothetical protein M3Q81_04480 [bacterium]|nr:hypothetical protein [bacterium]
MTDTELEIELQNSKNRADEIEKNHTRFMEELAEMLPPCVVDEVNIKLRVQELLDVEERLRKAERKNEDIRRDSDGKVTALVGEISTLRAEIEVQQKQNNSLLQRLEVLEERAKSTQVQSFVQSAFEKIFTKKVEQRPKTRLERWMKKISL